MKTTKNWSGNKHHRNLREDRKILNVARLGFTDPPKEHPDVSMDEVRQQALMMANQGFIPEVPIKSITVQEKPERKKRPPETK